MGFFRPDRDWTEGRPRRLGYWTDRAAQAAHGRHRMDYGYPDHPRNGLLARLPWRWRIAILVPLYAAAALFAGIGGLMIYYTMVFPDPVAIGQHERSPVIRVLARDGTMLSERGTAHDYMPLALIPSHVRDAIIATEDRRFRNHWGVDPVGILRASFANLRAGRYVQGGSTITQQLAKNVFLSSERTMERKFEEVLLALWLELRLKKDDILELYLNRVYFGAGVYGIEGAAQRYFDKSVRNLTLPEAAVIAGLLKAPSRFSPAANPGAARLRGRVVLAAMRDAGFIDARTEEAARAESVAFADRRPGREATGFEYAVDFILERLPPLVGAGHAELIVETTIDASLQKATQRIVQDVLDKQGRSMGASQGAALVLDRDGGVLALTGGRNHAESQFNRAVRSERQPGSAFKPILYLAALEAGLAPDTIVQDVPTTIDGWTPRNDDGLHRGRMTLRTALARSVNTVAVRLQADLGASRVIETARRLGIASDLHGKPSLALGTSEVTPLELATTYATLASGGMSIRPHGIRRVRMGTGRVLYARQSPRATRVAAPEHVAQLTDMLYAAVETGTGRRARLSGHPVAGKTGTTQDFRDAWFVGYTGHATALVWIGNDDSRPMEQVAGGTLPAEIWRRVMTTAHADLERRELPGAPAAASRVPVPKRAPDAPVAIRKEENTPSEARLSRFAGPALATMRVRDEPQPAKAEPSAPGRSAPGRGRIDEAFVLDVLRGLDTAVAANDTAAQNGRLGGFPPGKMALGGAAP